MKKDDRLAHDNHSFLQISDTEIGEKGVGEWMNEVKEIADREKPAFLIHTGDICYEEGLKKHLSEMNSENMCLPVYYTIGNHDYPIDCGVYCINADDGSIIWKYKTKNSVKSNIRFSNDKIIVQDTAANIYIFDANSDEQNPEIVKAPVGASINTSSSICIDEGVAYVGSASAVSAINIDNGEILWSNERNHGENSPAEFIVCEDKVIVSSHWDALVALDKKNGKQIWENKDETIRFRSSTPVVIDNETLLVADSNAIMTVNTKDGKIINKTEFDEYSFSSSSQPYIENGTAYIATANKGVIAYDLKTFEVLWETPVKTALLHTSPYLNGNVMTVESSFVSVGDSLLFASSDGYVYMVNKSDGKITDEKFVGASVLNTPVVYENSVIVSDFSGRIIKF